MASHKEVILSAFGWGLLLSGSIFAGLGWAWERESSLSATEISAVMAEAKPVTFKEIPAEDVEFQAPINIYFPNLNELRVNLVKTNISENGYWVIPKSIKAAYLESSAKPGEKGNIIIYGHNKADVFGNLKSSQIGDQITLTDLKQRERTYEIGEILIVNPDQVEVLAPTEEEILTIYTCTGWLDRQRLVIKARPIQID